MKLIHGKPNGEGMRVEMTIQNMSDIQDALEAAGEKKLAQEFQDMIDSHYEGVEGLSWM